MLFRSYSRQRESIKACLMGRRDHPTADHVYLTIREVYPNISLGTVYRNLNLLVELGEARKLSFGYGPDRFDGDLTPHYHFVCRGCGSISDLPLEPSDQLNRQAQSCCPGRIDSHLTYFYGLCPDCLKKMSEKKSQ